MNNQQFIYWLSGVIDAVGQEGPTSEQWETIVSKLNQVAEPVSFPFGTPNTAPNTIPFVQPLGPYRPFEGSYRPFDTVLTTTTGSGTVYGNFGSITTNGNTSVTAKIPENSTLTIGNTVTTLPKGTTLNYTANLPEEL